MEKSYQKMNVKELKALAKERGIKGYYRLRKAELIRDSWYTSTTYERAYRNYGGACPRN